MCSWDTSALSIVRNLDGVVLRSSHLKVFCEKGVLRNFAKFTGKHLCQRCFPVNFAKYLRTPFFKEHLRWLFCRTWDFLRIAHFNDHGRFWTTNLSHEMYLSKGLILRLSELGNPIRSSNFSYPQYLECPIINESRAQHNPDIRNN